MEASFEANIIVVMQAVAKLELKTQSTENLCPDEVLVKILKVCICGVDEQCVYDGQVGDMKVETPCGVCTACMGVVVDCGCAVTDLKKGDRVTIEPGTPCSCCDMCKCGCYNMCKESNCYIAEDMCNGCLAKYCKRKAHLVHKLPDCVCDDDGAFVEPLSVALYACNRGQVGVGSKVVVTGANCMGLLSVAVAKAMGATNIMVTDNNQCLLTLAEEMGADHTLLVPCDEDPESVAQKIEDEMGCEPCICIESTGTQQGMAICIYAAEACGTIVQLGICCEDVTLPLCHATMREIDILGICCSANCFPTAIDMLANDMVCVKKLIGKCFDLKDCQEAFDYYHENDDCVCCMVNCDC